MKKKKEQNEGDLPAGRARKRVASPLPRHQWPASCGARSGRRGHYTTILPHT
ncbi:unnamed protein product [Spirodela intermedia]|uniref:Uncharacterized protein n=1 Tax=Spirodela intermedia TaxID=51605 RepID=A0A7I8L4R4_SPIIN|nr:unnamed protein product [Spirodela intermedia]